MVNYLYCVSIVYYIHCIVLLINRDSASNNSEIVKPETLAYEATLRNELLGERIAEIPVNLNSKIKYLKKIFFKFLKDLYTSKDVVAKLPLSENLFKFTSPSKQDIYSPYSVSPISKATYVYSNTVQYTNIIIYILYLSQ